jgi:hypothetical protein
VSLSPCGARWGGVGLLRVGLPADADPSRLQGFSAVYGE